MKTRKERKWNSIQFSKYLTLKEHINRHIDSNRSISSQVWHQNKDVFIIILLRCQMPTGHFFTFPNSSRTLLAIDANRQLPIKTTNFLDHLNNKGKVLNVNSFSLAHDPKPGDFWPCLIWRLSKVLERQREHGFHFKSAREVPTHLPKPRVKVSATYHPDDFWPKLPFKRLRSEKLLPSQILLISKLQSICLLGSCQGVHIFFAC